MKNNLIKKISLSPVLIFSLLIIFFTGCKKDSVLDVTDEAAITPESTWQSEETSDLFLNDIYGSLPNLYGYQCFDPLENWTDNAMAGFGWSKSCNDIRTMSITPSTSFTDGWYPSACTYFDNWSDLYNHIRKCNVFIKNVNASTYLSQSYKDKRLGEAHVIRAYFYHFLWMSFGGVPLITSPDEVATQGDAIFHARATSDETYNFIISDLDSAIATLTANTGNDGNGRVNLGAALTLKGWVQLVYASKLHNSNNDIDRWKAAAATNKQVMSLGYSLYPKYDELFFETGNSNNEGIFYKEYLGNVIGSFLTNFQGPSHVDVNPSQWLSWGGSTPTQNLVDDYAMANGKAITDAGSGYNANNPYANREPRFYQSILYNNSTFNGTPFTSYDGVVNGLVANNPIDLSDQTDYTNTGYCTKKRIDTTVNIFQWGATGQCAYYFRYAEVLLNYAEAENEAVGPDASVYAALDQIRTRAGIPTITTVYPNASQDEMRTIIRRERRVELAFEDKRWWDLLRWKTAEVNLNQTMNAMYVTYSNGQWVYKVQAAARGKHTFDASKNYLLPIPQTAIEQNSKLTQNPGY